MAAMMGLLLQGVLLICVSALVAGFDFHQGPKTPSAFVKHTSTEDTVAKIQKRSLTARLTSLRIKRRSADPTDACEMLKGYDKKLANNTHLVSY